MKSISGVTVERKVYQWRYGNVVSGSEASNDVTNDQWRYDA